MLKLITFTQAYLSNKEGATAIEYGLIAAGISVAIVVIVVTLGDNLETTFTTVSDAIAANDSSGE